MVSGWLTILFASSLACSVTAAGPKMVFDTVLHNPCEAPSLPAGQIHVVVGGWEERNCFTQYLWNVGLSNAYVYVYRRVASERPLKHWRGPCGMVVHERLLLPNRGRETSAFFDYVLEHYENPPSAVVFLHGHGPYAYHTDCPTIVGRSRLFYRGLVSPNSVAAEFSKHMVTLTRPGLPGDADWMQSSLTPHNLDDDIASLDEQSPDYAILASCKAVYTKWSVNLTVSGYYSCCATFILPWERILKYQKGFYRDALLLSLEEEGEYLRSKACWEFLVYTWFQEPVQSITMTDLYSKASSLAKTYDHASCSGTEPIRDC